jgi:hypothetical protein
MIDIDTQVEPIKVTCYLMICRVLRIKQWCNDVDLVNFVNSVL